jgi:hypothetical protein
VNVSHAELNEDELYAYHLAAITGIQSQKEEIQKNSYH